MQMPCRSFLCAPFLAQNVTKMAGLLRDGHNGLRNFSAQPILGLEWPFGFPGAVVSYLMQADSASAMPTSLRTRGHKVIFVTIRAKDYLQWLGEKGYKNNTARRAEWITELQGVSAVPIASPSPPNGLKFQQMFYRIWSRNSPPRELTLPF